MTPGKKVLVVDDDKDIHPLLRLHLQKEGFQVFSALDSAQGTMMAKQVKPDLIILDIMMPAGGGFAVYDRLRMMSSSFQTPFLIYSAMTYSAIATKIPEGPLVKILSKTVKMNELVQAVKDLTGT